MAGWGIQSCAHDARVHAHDVRQLSLLNATENQPLPLHFVHPTTSLGVLFGRTACCNTAHPQKPIPHALFCGAMLSRRCSQLAGVFSSFKGTQHSERLRLTFEEVQTVRKCPHCAHLQSVFSQ
jgi:hypothetical protein